MVARFPSPALRVRGRWRAACYPRNGVIQTPASPGRGGGGRCRMRALALVVLVLAVSAVGCDENPVSPSELVDITWQLQSVSRVGNPVVNVPNPEQFTVRFETNNTIAVRADCNTCTGGYTLDGESLSIGQLACTLIACP